MGMASKLAMRSLDQPNERGSLVDRIDALVRGSRMRAPAVHPNERAHAALVRDDDSIGSGLAHDTGVDLWMPGHVGASAAARHLLIGDEYRHERARPALAGRTEHLDGFEHRDDR